jgi:GT2 family glycosyltransferase
VKQKLQIIIPSFNRKICLDKLVQCLLNLDKGNFILTIVIVVDGSTDGTYEMLEKYKGKLEIISGDGYFWWTKCINIGLKYNTGIAQNYYLLLNDDTLLPDNFFINLNNLLKDNPNSLLQLSAKNIVTNEYFDIGSYISMKNPFKRFHFINYIKNDIEIPKYRLVNYLHGRGMIISSIILKSIGLLDEKNFPQYFSDSDFALRAKKVGFNLVISRDCFLYVHTEKTGRTLYENEYSFRNFIKRLFEIKSPSNLKFVIKYNIRHVPFLLIIPYTLVNICFILIGYFKRWYRFKRNV